ncbi:unnamed protein product [Allacma fusca]|uniref:Ig-like domain-containing protein n=1 Tax=Allacma fusca TaxID=39272 RepID=A0A8J2LE46_9HEXA|nr:unnamed protein product [Allacma fusca]
MENVHVPRYEVAGADVDLFCYFSLSRNHTLYSLKWFKDGMEFFRFVPENTQPISLYWVTGIRVDGDKSNLNRVHLKNLTELSSGTYQCEVQEDLSFLSSMKQAEMTVLAGPSSDPQLEGFESSVTTGDILEGNCTIPVKSSLVKLTFYVNNELMEDSYLKNYGLINGSNGKLMSVLGLKLTVGDKHWTKSNSNSSHLPNSFNYLELKCVATMDSIDSMWVKVKIIQESHPTLRRFPPRRRLPPVTRTGAEREGESLVTSSRISPCDSNNLLISRIAELISNQNEELAKLSQIENSRLQTEREAVALRREELGFFRDSIRNKAPSNETR